MFGKGSQFTQCHAFGFDQAFCEVFQFQRFWATPCELFRTKEYYSPNVVGMYISTQFIKNDDWWEET